MDPAQSSPLFGVIGVVVGVSLKAGWDWVNRRHVEAREDRLHFRDRRLDACADFMAASDDAVTFFLQVSPRKDDWGRDPAQVQTFLLMNQSLMRANFLVRVLCPGEVSQMCKLVFGHLSKALGLENVPEDPQAWVVEYADLAQNFRDAVATEIGVSSRDTVVTPGSTS